MDHYVVPPPPQEEYCARIYLFQEDSHGTSCTEVEVVDFVGHKPNFWVCCPDNRSDGGDDIGAADLLLCTGILYICNGGVTGGVIILKIYRMATHYLYCTPDGVASAAVPDGFSLDTIFFYGKY